LAGAAEVDISPPLGTHLLGDLCRLRPADEIVDPIYARALVVQDGEGDAARRLCVISMDLLSINNECTDLVRRAIEERFGLPPEAVMLHTTQNHSSPAFGKYFIFTPDSPYVREDYWWVHGGDRDYPDFVLPKVLTAVEQALGTLQPVTIGVTHGMDGRIGFNRRFIKRDGTVQTIPRAPDLLDILQVEGPTDPEVAIVCLYNEAEQPIAALLHHTAHPVSLWGTCKVTASWPGAWCRRFKEVVGDQCVPMMINGCCGNISPSNPLDRDHSRDDENIAECLMQTTTGALKRMKLDASSTVDFRSRTLTIARPELDQDELTLARKVYEEHPEPKWANGEHTLLDVDWAFALVLLDLQRKFQHEPNYEYEVQAFRIGDVALVGLIGEPFVEGQLEIKLHSPAERTLVAHMCNGYVGYIPPRECYERFNYNFYAPDGRPVRRGATRFMLVPEALERIVDAAAKLLHELFPEAGSGLAPRP